jgi:hypothetical protein
MTHREKIPLSFFRSGARGLAGFILSALLAPVRADSSSMVVYAPPEVMSMVTTPVPSQGVAGGTVITGQELFLIAAGLGIIILAGILAFLIRSGCKPASPPEKKR